MSNRVDDLDKLTKCLRLLSSSIDGEVLAAARAIVTIQKSKNLDIAQIVEDLRNATVKQANAMNTLQKNHQKELSQYHRAWSTSEKELKKLKEKSLFERVFKW